MDLCSYAKLFRFVLGIFYEVIRHVIQDEEEEDYSCGSDNGEYHTKSGYRARSIGQVTYHLSPIPCAEETTDHEITKAAGQVRAHQLNHEKPYHRSHFDLKYNDQ